MAERDGRNCNDENDNLDNENASKETNETSNDREQVLEEITHFLEQFTGHAPNNECRAANTRPELVHKRFKMIDPQEFSDSTDPLLVEGWIKSLVVIFDIMQLGDANLVSCTKYLLKDDARIKWNGVKLTVNFST